MNNTRAALIKKIKKLAALASQGLEGEKEAAAMLLDRLMIEYGITDADLEEETTALEWFKYKDDLQKQLLCQVLYMVMGDGKTYKRKDGRGKMMAVYCTAAERIEIEIAFDFFNRAMMEELERFFEAFAIKNHLFPPPDKRKTEPEEKKLNESDLLKLSCMLKGMERHSLRKMIGGPMDG
jgi:hypothetical protein